MLHLFPSVAFSRYIIVQNEFLLSRAEEQAPAGRISCPSGRQEVEQSMRRILFLTLLLVITAAPSVIAEQPPFGVYTVKAGDTVDSVAGRYGVDPANLASANGIAANDGLPPEGTVLLVPKSPRDVLATLYEAKRRGLGAWPKPKYADEFLPPLTEEPPSAPKERPQKAEHTPAPAVSSQQPAAPADGTVRTHKVQEGETMYGISRLYGLSLSALLQANNLTESSIIKIGETLTIPGTSAEKPEPHVQRPTPPQNEPIVEKTPSKALPSPTTPMRLTWPLRGGPPPTHTGTSFGEGLSAKAAPGEPVHAAADATVLHGGWMRNFGNAIYLNHGNGIATFYGGLGIIYVKSGEKIRRGTKIALVGEIQGAEPRFVFHVLKEGKSVDPRPWIEGAKQ